MVNLLATAKQPRGRRAARAPHQPPPGLRRARPAPARPPSPGSTANCSPRWACCPAASSSRWPAPTWSAGTSATPRSSPGRSSTGRAAACCSSTRRTPSRPGRPRQRLRPGGGGHAAEADGGPPRRGGGHRGRLHRRRWSGSWPPTPACRRGSPGAWSSPTTPPTNWSPSSGSTPRAAGYELRAGRRPAAARVLRRRSRATAPSATHGSPARCWRRMMTRQAGRLSAMAAPSLDDLRTLLPEDVTPRAPVG